MVGGAAVAAAEWPSVSLFRVSRSVLGKRLRALATGHWRLSHEHSPDSALSDPRGLRRTSREATRASAEVPRAATAPTGPLTCRLRLTVNLNLSSFRPAGGITIAGRRHRPAEVPKGTIQGHLWLPTASLRFHINMAPPTDPLGVRACPIDAFGGLGKAQWARLPELCFYRKKPEISRTAGTEMLVSQSILRLLRNAVARWNQCLICGSLGHVP